MSQQPPEWGVMFSDGSVAARWNGRTQRAQAATYAAHVVADQMATAGRHDHITLAHRSPGQPWVRVAGIEPATRPG